MWGSKINETSNYNNNQPVVLNNKVVDGNHKRCTYRKYVPLMSSNEKLTCSIVRDILYYY